MSLTEVNRAIIRTRDILNDLENHKVGEDTCKIQIGLLLATLPADVKRKDVFDGVKGARGYEKVKGDLSKAATIATTFILGLGKDVQDVVEVVRGPDGLPRSKGWRRLYDAYNEKIKPGEWTAQKAWDEVAAGWTSARYTAKGGPGPTKRHIVVSIETGERFDAYAEVAGDADVALGSLMDDVETLTVPAQIARVVHEFLAAGGLEAALEARIRAATAKVQADREGRKAA